MGVALQKLVIIVIQAFLHTMALIFTLLVWKPNPGIPIVFLSISMTMFMCLTVDLARQEFQKIAYYPISNLIFLVTFTISCIMSKHPLTKNYWPLLQFTAVLYYTLHEQYTIRQILYNILENDEGIKSVILLASGLLSCTIMHIGCGTIIRKLIEKAPHSSFIQSDNEELEEIRNDQEFVDLMENSRLKKIEEMDKYDHSKQEDSELIKFFQDNRELPELIKAVIILAPPLIDFISFIWELLISESKHTHGHTHQHLHFSSKSAYFQDITTESTLSMLLSSIRLVCSGIIFHCLFVLWNKCLSNINQHQMKSKYWLSFGGLCVGIGRLLTERL